MKSFFALTVLCFLFVLPIAGTELYEEPYPSEYPSEVPPEDVRAFVPGFSIVSLIRTSLDGELFWDPGWPFDIPPDGFSLKTGMAESIQIEIDDKTAACQWNSEGRLIKFPFFTEDTLNMASVYFDEAGEAVRIDVSGAGEMLIEILETKNNGPALARIFCGGEYFFVVFHYWSAHVSETWYTAGGAALGLFTSEYMRVNEKSLVRKREYTGNEDSIALIYDYDSWGNVSQINVPGVTVSALYNKHARPKYIKRIFHEGQNPEDFTFQWDERNLLVSLKGSLDENTAEILYEYSFDSQDNWIERREIFMLRQGGYIFSSPGRVIRRSIDYLSP